MGEIIQIYRDRKKQEGIPMKLGFVTAILDSWTYEEMMDFASEQGFECVEVACWPQEKAERRYAGVSHIDAERVNREDAPLLEKVRNFGYCI